MTPEDEAFDELEKSLQRKVAHGVTDGSKKDAALRLAREALENSVDLVSNEAREAESLYGKYPSRLARVQGLVALEVAHQTAIKAIDEALEDK